MPWLVSLDGTWPPKPLEPEAGVVSVKFGTSHERYVSREASLAAMPRSVVRTVQGAESREIPSVAESPGPLPAVEITEVGPDRLASAS